MANLLQKASGVEPEIQQQNQGEDQSQRQGGWIESQDDAGSEMATPEEEAQMEALVAPVMGLIHGEATSGKVLEMLKNGAQNLADTIGKLASQMLTVLQNEVERSGKAIDDSVVMQAGELVVTELIDVAQAAGLVGDDEESQGKLFEAAILAGLQAHGKATADKTGESPDQARQKLNGILDSADQEGGPQANKLTSAIRGVINGGGQ